MPEDPILIVDGHTHITNRVYWEKVDPWKPQAFGFDYARAYDAGVRLVIENISPYGYNNFNYTPKQVLRLIEIFHRVLEQHGDRMGIVLRGGDARKIIAAGKMAVVLSVESGFDHEGDLDVLRSLFRLGLRAVQFATQTCCNAFADSSIGGPGVWGGINSRGRELVKLMNELGILIDLTHASQETQVQVIAASEAPVVASHVAMEAVSGDGTPDELMSDEVLRALSAKGGMVGIIGVSARLSKRYRDWARTNPSKLHGGSAALQKMVGFDSPLSPHALAHGEFGAWLDSQMRDLHLTTFTPWEDPPESADAIPTADEWASHAAHVIKTVGPEHVGIGLDLGGPRSSVPKDATGYPDLMAALRRITDEKTLRLIAGENWLRVLDQVLPGASRVQLHDVPSNAGDKGTISYSPANSHVSFSTTAESKPFDMQVLVRHADKSVRTAHITGNAKQNMRLEMGFDATKETFTFQHQGNPGQIVIHLGYTLQNSSAEVTLAPVAVQHGDTITLRPNWRDMKGANPGTLEIKSVNGAVQSHKIQ